ncbi:proteasome subunit alpha type-5 [Drosophila innubila]|uniref:proteasome subunit alpha type-5 n=1 Tax=Drosophila innubila TaxID=198719 RepID=UPI00148B94D2|nr:proteasome subunit alpha type-5 [Drosophila innubila]
MFMTRSEYDRGVNTFSPEGRLFQVEYAIEAIKLGSTAIGICTNDSVVLAVEKRITSPLMVPKTVEKIVKVDEHIGCATSGLMADARTLIERARVECQNHWFVYNETMTVESCAQAVSTLAIQFGDSGDSDGASAMSRPFGVAILFAGFESGKPQLWHMDPSGTYIRYCAKAIGSGSEGAQQNLQDKYTPEMKVKDAIDLCLNTLKQVMEEKLNETNVELMTMTMEKKEFTMLSEEEVKKLIEDLA